MRREEQSHAHVCSTILREKHNIFATTSNTCETKRNDPLVPRVQMTESKSMGNAKVLYLIRHGESQGQVAKHNGLDRKRDPSLIDAGLTNKGWGQAKQIPHLLGTETMSSIDLVVSSPLTRALHTALVGFQDRREDSSFVLHYDIREIGSSIPENIPRPIENVIHDLKVIASSGTSRPSESQARELARAGSSVVLEE